MFKNSPPICYIFFATDDVTVMSVNTYTSMMRLALKISTWSYLYDKIRNMEQSNCLNCFLTETEVLMDWKRWSKKWQHRYCVDSARSTTTQYVKQQYLCCQFFSSAL